MKSNTSGNKEFRLYLQDRRLRLGKQDYGVIVVTTSTIAAGSRWLRGLG